MTEYIYQGEDFISHKDYSYFNETMQKYDWDPVCTEKEGEFKLVLNYLINLIVRAPLFLPAYEIALNMVESKENEEEIDNTLLTLIEQKWFEACGHVVAKDNVFDKIVRYSIVENRPLLKGLNSGAEVMWVVGEFDKAHNLFAKLKELDPDDRMGTRYSVKATKERMEYEEFQEKFTVIHKGEEHVDLEGLKKWYGES